MSYSRTGWLRWSFDGEKRWGDWRRLTETTIAGIPALPGAYALALPGGRGIQRLLDLDPHGVLDIGESDGLADRVWSLRGCMANPGATGHMAGWRLGALGLLKKIGCEPSELRIAWAPTRSKEEAYAEEGRAMRYYFEVFGELPPLNYKFNWSSFD